jgi:hypothetical protein
MLKKLVTIIIMLSLLPVFLYSQDRAILKPNGEYYWIKGESKGLDKDYGGFPKGYRSEINVNKSMRLNPPVTPMNPMNLIDTLFIPGPYRNNPGTPWFGFYGQDVMVMWYECPADLYLLQVGFWCGFDTTLGGGIMEVKVVNLNWTTDQINQYLPSNDVGPLGYYEAQGNPNYGAAPFMDDPDVTGGWVALPPYQDTIPPFSTDIWSDGGVGAPVTVIVQPAPQDPIYSWAEMSLLGDPPDLSAGTLFGIAVKNASPIEWQGYTGFGVRDNYGVPLFKYYADGRNTPGPAGDYGWWVRPVPSLAFAAIVEIYGNTPPDINTFTQIYSDVNTGPFTIEANITDENPGNPDSAGVASAMIQWSTDGGTTWNDAAMTGTEPDFTGQIPTQPGNTMVTYRISATDITNQVATTVPVDFYVFEPSGANTLVIFNGFDELTGLAQDNYWPSNVSFEHDAWNYGAATDGLLENYDNVLEFWNENFGVYNDSTIRIWIEGAGNRNYFLAGQEYLGAWNGYDDTSFVAGDFIYDILGIDSSFNDISYYTPLPAEVSVGDSLPTLLLPEAGTLFGQPLADLLASVTGADSLMFNPVAIYQTNDNVNWQDGFHALSDVEVDMRVETRGIGSSWQTRHDPIVRILPTAAHRTLPAGNKIVFNAYDPVSLTTANDDSYPYWYWVGPDSANTVYQALKWFDIVLDANETGGAAPIEFALEQNYPNPFNPATTIKFSIPEASEVTLKVYDVLGREVRTLVNELRNAGSHEVNFDASNLASGMYIYSIEAGEFISSKKMILLK